MCGCNVRGDSFVAGIGSDSAAFSQGVIEATGGEIQIEQRCSKIPWQPSSVDREGFVVGKADAFEDNKFGLRRHRQPIGHRGVDGGAEPTHLAALPHALILDRSKE